MNTRAARRGEKAAEDLTARAEPRGPSSTRVTVTAIDTRSAA